MLLYWTEQSSWRVYCAFQELSRWHFNDLQCHDCTLEQFGTFINCKQKSVKFDLTIRTCIYLDMELGIRMVIFLPVENTHMSIHVCNMKWSIVNTLRETFHLLMSFSCRCWPSQLRDWHEHDLQHLKAGTRTSLEHSLACALNGFLFVVINESTLNKFWWDCLTCFW